MNVYMRMTLPFTMTFVVIHVVSIFKRDFASVFEMTCIGFCRADSALQNLLYHRLLQCSHLGLCSSTFYASISTNTESHEHKRLQNLLNIYRFVERFTLIILLKKCSYFHQQMTILGSKHWRVSDYWKV